MTNASDKDPFFRRHPWFTVCLLIAVPAILATAATGAVSNRDGGNGLCLSCHEMEQNVFVEFKKTKHYTNPSGVRARCSSCHVPGPVVPMIKRKLASVREVISWTRGTIDTPEKFEENRLRLAKSVWADFEASDSRECRSCHVVEAFDFAKFANQEEVKRMKKGLDEGQTCIACHKGIAHEMPDMAAGYRALFMEIQAEAKDGGADGDIIYPVRVINCFADKDGKKIGRLLPLTSLQVLDRSGDWIKVRVHGWQQEGAERAVYEKMGRRIFAAVLSRNAKDMVSAADPVTDPDTDLVWRKAELECWIKTGTALAETDRLNDYGSELHAATCGNCHALTPASHFKANQWIGGIKSMGRRISLSKDEHRYLLKYLQLRASDVAQGSHS